MMVSTPAAVVTGVIALFFVLCFLGLGVVGAYVMGKSVAPARRAFRYQSMRLVDAADLPASGRVAVQGTVQCPSDDAVETPFFGWTVACATCRVQQFQQVYYSNGVSGQHWETDHEWTVGTPFTVSDGTGSITVDPAEAALRVTDERTEHREYDSAGHAPRGLHDFLEQEGITDDVPIESRRFTELSVRPGDTVLVHGSVVDTGDEKRLASDGGGLLVTTRPPRALVVDEVVQSLTYLLLGGIAVGIVAGLVGLFLVRVA